VNILDIIEQIRSYIGQAVILGRDRFLQTRAVLGSFGREIKTVDRIVCRGLNAIDSERTLGTVIVGQSRGCASVSLSVVCSVSVGQSYVWLGWW
jgi:hypothetical protein